MILKIFHQYYSQQIRLFTNRYSPHLVGRLSSLFGITMKKEDGDMVEDKELNSRRSGEYRELEDDGNVLGGTRTQAGKKGGCCGARGKGPPGRSQTIKEACNVRCQDFEVRCLQFFRVAESCRRHGTRRKHPWVEVCPRRWSQTRRKTRGCNRWE